MAKLIKERYRNICMILYPDYDESHMKALQFIQQNYQYASIVHDKDIDESGEPKKKHVHVMARFGNARWVDSIASELGIEPNYIHKCGSLEKYGRYLVHADDPEKAQYLLEDVQGDLRPLVAKALENQKTEDEKVLAVIQLLDEIEFPLNVKQFITIMAQHGLYSEVRRNGYMMVKVLEIHNEEVLNKQRAEGL